VNVADIVWVGLAGSVGAVTRLVADGAVRGRVVRRVPVATVIINVSGSLVLGVLSGLVMWHGAPATLTLVAGAGFCGGYTTFSTASVETIRLLQDGDGRAALLDVGTTLVGALAAAGLGLAVAAL
jgi:CrcB protein